jgi:hypothetical protein
MLSDHPEITQKTILFCRKAAYPVSRSVSKNLFVKNLFSSLFKTFSFRNHKNGAYQPTTLPLRHLAPTSQTKDRVSPDLV